MYESALKSFVALLSVQGYAVHMNGCRFPVHTSHLIILADICMLPLVTDIHMV